MGRGRREAGTHVWPQTPQQTSRPPPRKTAVGGTTNAAPHVAQTV